MSVSDTSPEASTRQVEIWRSMTHAEKARVVDKLNADVWRMAETGVRLRHPDATDREVFLRVAALRNGRELSIAVYGWDPEIRDSQHHLSLRSPAPTIGAPGYSPARSYSMRIPEMARLMTSCWICSVPSKMS
jgi:hypothetical protein